MPQYDDIDAMLGLGMEDPNRMAAGLRRQAYAGDIMASTSIGNMQRGGISGAKAAREGAKQAGVFKRARDADDKKASELRAKEDRLFKRTLKREERDLVKKTAQEKRNVDVNINKEDRGMDDYKEKRLFDIENPMPYRGRGGAGGSSFGQMGKIERRDFEKLGADIAPVSFAIDSFEDKFAQPTFMGMEMEGVPLYNKAENWVADNAPILTDQDTEDKAAWWAQYRKFYELMERHNFFGAALTPTEVASWKSANINESMEADDIKKRLDAIMGIKKKSLEKAGNLARMKGASEEYISEVLNTDAYEAQKSITFAELEALGISPEEAEADNYMVVK